MDLQPYLDLVAQHEDADEDYQELIARLKERGATQMECVKALVYGRRLSLSEADALVLNAPAWQESLVLNQHLREAFWAHEGPNRA